MTLEPRKHRKNAFPFVRVFEGSDGLAQNPIAQARKGRNRSCGKSLERFSLPGPGRH